jgi:hypothetical protein
MKMDLIVGRKDMIRKKIGNQQDFMDLNFVYDMAVQQFKYNDNHEWVSPKPTFEQVVDTVIGQIHHVMERIRPIDLDNIDNVYRIYKNVLSKYRRYNKFISSTDREPKPFETFIKQVVHQHQQNRQNIVSRKIQKIQKIGEQHGLDPAFVHQMAVTVMRYVSPKPTFENAVDIVLGQIRRIIEILDRHQHQRKTKTKDNVYRMYTKILAKYFRERTKKKLDTPHFDTFMNSQLERL